MKTITIDGNSFNDLASFYDEAQQKLCPDFVGFGRNFDAFNDILCGGFGLFEYGEPIKLVWKQSEKSKTDLDYDAYIDWLQKIKPRAHPSNLASIDKRIAEAEKHRGPTLFDALVGIIKGPEHESHIELVLA